MAKSPNTDPFNNTWSYDWSWTQPQVSMNDFFQGKECSEIYDALSVEQELDALDKADEAVQNMLTYPEAQCIIADIMMKRKGKND